MLPENDTYGAWPLSGELLKKFLESLFRMCALMVAFDLRRN
jgi:hypothetical protein